jgi:hypothetical protein
MLRFGMEMRNLLLGALCASLALSACSAVQAQDNRFVVFSHGKHGYIDRDGKVVIPISLEGTYVLHFSEGLVSFSERVKPEPRRLPYVDEKGKLHIHAQEKWGFIDVNGAVVVAPKFDAVAKFSEGLAAVAFDTDRTSYSCIHCDPNQQWGFIDKLGKMVIQAQYRSALSFSEGLAAVMNDNRKWGYIDTKGMLVIPFAFQSARPFSGGLAPVSVNRKVGYIDKKGNFVIKPQFAEAGDFSEGLAAVRRGGKTEFMILGPAGGKWAFIGKDGKNRIVLPVHTEQARDFADGLAAIEVGNRCGYVDKSGAFVIPTAFSFCDDFSEGLADVLSNEKWQYIDTKGRVVLEVPYDQVRAFKNGSASVDEGKSGPDQKFGYIDKRGKQIWKPQRSL